ncbi:lysophospholipid transporter LplT [Candidatus Methylospira mobilis]|uniref:Lysophospholipid transporter LplT n=1 Tax=Candidatus Methylospira mobilis TaxID=1808979 RepID=A0A5Q0BFA2_9GAMM|nr:lysophospholipid transporter LplT [Candidatus Methylospira mobilis]QFY42199.1 lysophospholipid transporter LplT [Candidatus Methylospira mobilis]WNV03214.1 lysophospholipid transporter LplT [Candidatus Methylospira mobilis]
MNKYKTDAIEDTILPQRSLSAVMTAQFLSALADNALLFVAIALMRTQHRPEDWIPLLQISFVLVFVVVSPYVGHIADSWPKSHVMMVANMLKLIGAGCLLLGANPLVSYGVVGLGAALYSPAKYGILCELVAPEYLVKANSLMEGSTIVAILTGVAGGGWVVDHSVPLAFTLVIGCYVAAFAVNFAIPVIPAPHARARLHAWNLLKQFLVLGRTLVGDADARFSLVATSIFWGIGATLRILLVSWVPFALGIMDNQTAAGLNALVAVGVAVGASLASVFIHLKTVNRSMLPGLLLGPLVMGAVLSHSLGTVSFYVILIGLCGGAFVVPLNALLQFRGQHSIGSGNTVAVQNLFENIAMLVMLGVYTAAVDEGVTPVGTGLGLGLFILLSLAFLAWLRYRDVKSGA